MREVFVGEFLDDVNEIFIAQTALAGLEYFDQVRMRQFFGLAPARELGFGAARFGREKLDGGFFARLVRCGGTAA